MPVEAATLARGEIESVAALLSSNLEAENTVQVYAQASRLVTRLDVEEGHEVRRNQVLLLLQDEEQRGALARVESQLAKSRREHDRQESLFQKDLISEQVWNEAAYDLEQLEIARRRRAARARLYRGAGSYHRSRHPSARQARRPRAGQSTPSSTSSTSIRS